MTTIAYKTHVLQRFTDLHWRQAYLAAEAGDDVGGGEIDGLLVFAGLAVAGGDEFACKVWGLIGAVASVEPCDLVGLKPIPESRVEKMTNLGIHADIVDVGLPRVVDMIDLKDEPATVAGVVGEELEVVARGAERRPVRQPHLAAAIDRTVLDEGLRGHRLELVNLLTTHAVNLLHVDEDVLGEGEGIVLGHTLRVGLHAEIPAQFGRQQVVHKRRLIRALRTKEYENLMVHHLVVDRGSHHSHKPSAHVEVELFGCAVAAVNHTQEVGDMVVAVPFRQTVEIAFDGMVLFDAVAGEMQPNFTNSQKSMYIQSYNWL